MVLHNTRVYVSLSAGMTYLDIRIAMKRLSYRYPYQMARNLKSQAGVPWWLRIPLLSCVPFAWSFSAG